jgi:DNA-3-methyladenine glycosylase
MTTVAADTASRLGQPLGRDFYSRPVAELARALLGALLVSEADDGLAWGRIVETEAYAGPEDRASHARAGLTARTRPMFGPPGHAYVYLVYGLHECLNVVGGQAGEAGAVLVRALEPLGGSEIMRRRRGRPTDPDWRLAAGPARLAQALAVGRALDGHDLTTGRRLWLANPTSAADPASAADAAAVAIPSPADHEIAAGPRVGVAYAGPDWAARPWRFWLRGHRSVSRP